MTSFSGPMFFSERLREYQKSVAHVDPDFDRKLKQQELEQKYMDKMEEGCRVFAKELENINVKELSLTVKNSLKYKVKGAENSEYIYTGCPELKKFISHFNSKNNLNQIKLNGTEKFVNKISVNEDDVKNNKLNYELSFELDYKDEYKSGGTWSGNVKVPNPPSKDNVFFG